MQGTALHAVIVPKARSHFNHPTSFCYLLLKSWLHGFSHTLKHIFFFFPCQSLSKVYEERKTILFHIRLIYTVSHSLALCDLSPWRCSSDSPALISPHVQAVWGNLQWDNKSSPQLTFSLNAVSGWQGGNGSAQQSFSPARSLLGVASHPLLLPRDEWRKRHKVNCVIIESSCAFQ